MTEQYGNDNINLRDADPISVDTPEGSVTRVLLDTLTADGQSLTANIYGGGSAQDTPGTNKYVIDGLASATFAREGGVGSFVPALPIGLEATGAFPTMVFAITDDPIAGTTLCELVITAPLGFGVYNNRFKVSKLRY